MGIKCLTKPLVALIFLSFIFLNGCDIESPTVIQDSGSSTSLKQIKGKKGISHRNARSSTKDLGGNWIADNSQTDDDPQITVSTGNFWDRLRGSFQLKHYTDNPKVKSQINWFLHHQGYLNRSVKRASPYMYYIFEQVQKRNLPGELLLLPFIESAFNPFAYSGPGAAGLWQIMPQTGTGFGLKQNWWYDGRRDIHASTNAALDYLTYLQSYFDGDWLLAIAAYNTGEGTVQQAIRRNARTDKNTDFFSLGLSQETQSYVPRLLALAAIISNPEEYPIDLPPVRDEPYLAEVTVNCQIDLTEAAQLAGISQEEMRRLNPAYRHKLTRPHSSCRLLLPINHVDTFKNNLTQLSVVNQTSLQRYKVKRGETLESIAAHFQISSMKLRRINHLKVQKLRPGRVILVPVESPIITGNAKSSEVPVENNAEPAEKATKKTIDAESKTTEKPQEIEEPVETPVEKSEQLRKKPISSHASQQKILHSLKKGETLQKVAMRYHVKVNDLLRWNHLSKHTKLKIGKTIIIWQHTIEPVVLKPELHATSKPELHTATKSSPKNTKSVVSRQKKIIQKSSANTHRLARVSYKVHQGDTLAGVARKHHVSPNSIVRWNHLHRHAVHSGQVLVVYTSR